MTFVENVNAFLVTVLLIATNHHLVKPLHLVSDFRCRLSVCNVNKPMGIIIRLYDIMPHKKPFNVVEHLHVTSSLCRYQSARHGFALWHLH